MARFKPASEQIKVAKLATLEETRKVTIRVAKEGNAKVLVTEPRPRRFERIVDGVNGAQEEAVKPFGTILYFYPRVDVVTEFAIKVLREKSPVGPPEAGHYRDAHTIFLNGVAIDLPGLVNWKMGDDLAISNFVPYARKIEVGGMRMTVPGTDHVYERSVQTVRSRWGDLAKVSFNYRTISGDRFPAMIIEAR